MRDSAAPPLNTYDPAMVRAVSVTGAIVHAAIMDHQRTLGWCRCLHIELADMTGLNKRQVTHALAQLKAAGLIEEVSYPRHKAARAMNRRTLTP